MEVTLNKFKNNIDHYVSEAQKGNRIIIRHRKKVVASLEPPPDRTQADNDLYDAEELKLAAAGKLKLRKQALPDSFFEMPGMNIDPQLTTAAILADRYEED